jgi:hypothetical protein
MWLRCGEQFRRRYIEGEVIPPGVAARRGSAVHKAAEKNHRYKMVAKADLPLEDLQETARDEYTRLVRDEGVFIPRDSLSEAEKLIAGGLDEAVMATKTYRSEVAHQIVPVQVEVTLEANPYNAPLPLRGTLDVIEEGRIITDLKTMKRKDQEWADRDLQPTFYSVLHWATTGHWPEQFKYHIIPPGKKALAFCMTTNRGVREGNILARYLQAFFKSLESGDFYPADPGHWVCNPEYCGYFLTCPYVGNQLPKREV